MSEKAASGWRTPALADAAVVCASVGLFSTDQVEAIVDFVTHTYFRHFHLYKSIYTPFLHQHLVQTHIMDVQRPTPAPRLSQAIMHAAPQPTATAEDEGTLPDEAAVDQ